MTDEPELFLLEKRLGSRYARQRRGIEKDHEAQVFGQGINFFHIENLPIGQAAIRAVLMATGLYWRGLRNAAKVQVRRNPIHVPQLHKVFDGFTILQISDLHADLSEAAMARVAELVRHLRYDMCVLTGDYRGQTWGPYKPSLDLMEPVCAALAGPVYGVLGNHDTVLMVPRLEAMGVKMLLNEAAIVERDGQRIHLAGIDDAHFYRVDNIEKVHWMHQCI
jgi:predicted MPP superfamily phosphohydrolase